MQDIQTEKRDKEGIITLRVVPSLWAFLATAAALS